MLKTEGSISSMERDVKNFTATDRGENDSQSLYAICSSHMSLFL